MQRRGDEAGDRAGDGAGDEAGDLSAVISVASHKSDIILTLAGDTYQT